jgi:hypothetical protein
MLVLLCISMNLSAVDCTKCDCSHWPWKDECDQCCSLKLLNNSSSAELQNFLKLDAAFAKQLSTIKAKRGDIKSFGDLESAVGMSQISNIQELIREMPTLDRDYLLSTPEQKRALQKKIMESAISPMN